MEWLKGLVKRLFCRIDWHSFPVGYEHIATRGINEHARCKWCGFVGMVDSQGNLF